MSIVEDSPLSVETPAVPAHDSNAQANSTHHMGTAVFQGITLTRLYVRRAIQDVIKPAVKVFLENCDTNPRVAAIVAAPALLVFLLVLVFFIISTLVLVTWTILTITSSVIFVIFVGVISLFFKLLVLVLVTLPFAAIATGLLAGANTVSQSIIRRMPRNGAIGGPFVITQNVRETDWKSVLEYLANLGKKLGPGFAAALERLLVLWAALHNFQVVAGDLDLRNARVRSPRNDSPPNVSGIVVETSGEPSQGDSNDVYETQSIFEYTAELEPTGSGSTGKLKRRVPFSQTSEDAVDVEER